MHPYDAAILIVFLLFAVEVLARFGGWLFDNYRAWKDLREWFEEEDEDEAQPAV